MGSDYGIRVRRKSLLLEVKLSGYGMHLSLQIGAPCNFGDQKRCYFGTKVLFIAAPQAKRHWSCADPDRSSSDRTYQIVPGNFDEELPL
jgi:hypothetical protein